MSFYRHSYIALHESTAAFTAMPFYPALVEGKFQDMSQEGSFERWIASYKPSLRELLEKYLIPLGLLTADGAPPEGGARLWFDRAEMVAGALMRTSRHLPESAYRYARGGWAAVASMQGLKGKELDTRVDEAGPLGRYLKAAQAFRRGPYDPAVLRKRSPAATLLDSLPVSRGIPDSGLFWAVVRGSMDLTPEEALTASVYAYGGLTRKNVLRELEVATVSSLPGSTPKDPAYFIHAPEHSANSFHIYASRKAMDAYVKDELDRGLDHQDHRESLTWAPGGLQAYLDELLDAARGSVMDAADGDESAFAAFVSKLFPEESARLSLLRGFLTDLADHVDDGRDALDSLEAAVAEGDEEGAIEAAESLEIEVHDLSASYPPYVAGKSFKAARAAFEQSLTNLREGDYEDEEVALQALELAADRMWVAMDDLQDTRREEYSALKLEVEQAYPEREIEAELGLLKKDNFSLASPHIDPDILDELVLQKRVLFDEEAAKKKALEERGKVYLGTASPVDGVIITTPYGEYIGKIG